MWTTAIEKVTSALTLESTQLKEMWDNFPLGVLITNLEGVIIYYNELHSKIDALEQEDVIGKLEIEVLIPIAGPNIMKISQKTGQSILGYIFPYRTIKGRVINAAYWVFPIKKENEVIASICFTQPLLGELNNQSKPYKGPPIQWPGVGAVPINMPVKKIVGENRQFKNSIELTRSSANNPFAILISGETGSGKEMFAKLVHESSDKRKKTYMALNCSAIPGPLLEGLLFGTTKGSFTGAIDRAGLFEEANGGTIYLDEIDSMPLDLQPKLLRALQEMKISRVGSSKEIMLDIKLISSIGLSSQKALDEGRLRSDLFYRLAVVVVNVPPLRERLDDLELLAEHFICKYNNLLGKGALMLDKELLTLMYSYHWPGNVRELEHLIAGAVSLAGDEHILTTAHITEHYKEMFAAKKSDQGENDKFKSADQQVNEQINSTIEHFLIGSGAKQSIANKKVKNLILEQKLLSEALTVSKGNVSQAAKSMGVSRQVLSYRMMKYGLSRFDFR